MGVHVSLKDLCPKAIKWCGNRAVIIQFNNQDLFLYSIFGDYQMIERERGDKNKWSFLRQ